MQRATAPSVRLHDTVACGSGGSGINAKYAKQKLTRSGFAHAKKCKARSDLVPLVCEAQLFGPVDCKSARKLVRADGGLDFALVYIKVSVNVLNIVVFFKRFN